ncbi:MAG TPA: DUF882 domain-containing protein [Stellaceae bacterium]|nr:DUF882 domain-containing protein [Stellaceae bacterium]
MAERSGVTRRAVLFLAAGAIASAAACPASAAYRPLAVRTVALDNLHTGERVKTAFWENGRYLPEALREIDWVLRDHRTDEVRAIDPDLLDLLWHLQQKLRARDAFQVISGYRSPATNAMLAATTDGVAQNSLHTRGMAIDIRVPGRSLVKVHRAALDLGLGGVGYYPRSDFVHVDVGRVRRW